jgi:hypothetical protein
VTSIAHLLDELDLTAVVQHLEIKMATSANDEEGRLLALVSHDPVQIGDLSRQSALREHRGMPGKGRGMTTRETKRQEDGCPFVPRGHATAVLW